MFTSGGGSHQLARKKRLSSCGSSLRIMGGGALLAFTGAAVLFVKAFRRKSEDMKGIAI